MTKQFLIQGTIVDTDAERETPEDVCPQMFSEFMKTVSDGDDIEVLINSVGGSVTGGISIANMIKKAQGEGHETTAVVQGLAASIASVIACSCKTVKMYESSFMMIHNCWSVVQGNSTDLRREAAIMEKMNFAILSFYLDKFALEDQEILMLMENETWFSGREASSFFFKCEVIESKDDFKIAAKLTNFKNVPKALNMNKKNEEIEEVEAEEKEVETEEQTEPEVEPAEETQEQPAEEEKTEGECQPQEEEKRDEETPAETEEDEAEEEDECEKKPEDEIEKRIQARVSGMQSKMQSKINALTKDFQNQLKAKNEELSKALDALIGLKTELENAKNELQKTVSAFEEKEDALAKLNASVLTPKDNTNQVDWRNLKGKEFFDYLKKNKVH